MFRAAITAAILSGFLLATTGCLAQGKESAEQKAVRTYLKANLSSGKWEEIKWSGPLVRKDGKTAMRLKHRSANKFGEMGISDDAFLLKNGKVTDWLQDAGPSYVPESP